MYGQKVRLSLLLASLLALSTIVSACGGGEQATTGNPVAPDNKASQPVQSKEPVDLVFYSNSTDSVDSFNERFGDPLRKKFPNYNITYIQKTKDVTLPNLIASGQRIDIYWESVGQFLAGINESNLQYDMTDLIKKHNVDLAAFEPTLISAMRDMSGGKLYGLPVTNNTLSLFYNKEVFSKFGVPFPKDGLTWDDVMDISRKLTRTDGGKQYIGLGISQAHLLRLNPFSLPFVDPKTDKATINNDKWKAIFDYAFVRPAEAPGFRELIRASKNTMPASKSFTENKEMGMYVFLTTLIFAEGLPNIDWDLVSFPTYKEAPKQGPQTYPTYFAVTSTSNFKDDAMEAIKYLTSEENQLRLSGEGNMPVLKSEKVQAAFGKQTSFGNKNLKSVFYNKFAPISPKTEYDAIAEKIYRENIVKISLGEMDMNTFLREAEEKTNKAIAEEKSK
jgi:multiple sugar transport system substrate-binding protein